MKEVKRPWGLFKQFVLNKKCTVKILEINPKQELSLQKHKNREEHWYFLNNATIQIGSKKRRVKKGDLVKVPKGKPHRIIAEKNKTEILEICFGNFDEKDEVRLEDKYGRR